MNTNPDSPPVNSRSAVQRRAWVYVVMSWLSAILGVAVIAIAILGGYHNIRFILANGGQLSPYVVAVILLLLTCGLGLFYSAWHWRSQHVGLGLLSFLGSAIAFFAGPRLLLSVLGP